MKDTLLKPLKRMAMGGKAPPPPPWERPKPPGLNQGLFSQYQNAMTNPAMPPMQSMQTAQLASDALARANGQTMTASGAWKLPSQQDIRMGRSAQIPSFADGGSVKPASATQTALAEAMGKKAQLAGKAAFISGDSNDSKPNPELVITDGPAKIIPMRDLPKLPRFARGGFSMPSGGGRIGSAAGAVGSRGIPTSQRGRFERAMQSGAGEQGAMSFAAMPTYQANQLQQSYGWPYRTPVGTGGLNALYASQNTPNQFEQLQAQQAWDEENPTASAFMQAGDAGTAGSIIANQLNNRRLPSYTTGRIERFAVGGTAKLPKLPTTTTESQSLLAPRQLNVAAPAMPAMSRSEALARANPGESWSESPTGDLSFRSKYGTGSVTQRPVAPIAAVAAAPVVPVMPPVAMETPENFQAVSDVGTVGRLRRDLDEVGGRHKALSEQMINKQNELASSARKEIGARQKYVGNLNDLSSGYQDIMDVNRIIPELASSRDLLEQSLADSAESQFQQERIDDVDAGLKASGVPESVRKGIKLALGMKEIRNKNTPAKVLLAKKANERSEAAQKAYDELVSRRKPPKMPNLASTKR